MEIIKAILLGIIQGITEFLPISSSGHLAILHKITGFDAESNLFFDVTLHLGTLMAVIFYYRKDIYDIAKSFLINLFLLGKNKISRQSFMEDKNSRLGLLIITGTIPTVIIGLLIKDYVEGFAKNLIYIGIALIITSILLFIYELKKQTNKGIKEFRIKDSLVIGLVQGLAIFPGISRSGSTIASGKILGLKKDVAANYSFLLSIPAILGAFLFQLKDSLDTKIKIDIIIFAIGFTTSFITGYFSLKLLIWLIKKANLRFFIVYCFFVGVIAIVYNYI